MKCLSTVIRCNSITALLVTVALLSAAPSKAAQCPCDIYATGDAPCVAAYSTVRLLSSTYTGPLYQVRRTSDKQTKDIFALTPSGIANAAVQDSFLGSGAGTVAKIYDQSGKGNDLIKAPKGCYECDINGTSCQDDFESDAKGRTVTIGGHKAYALKMKERDGYRNNNAKDMPEGLKGQGIYMVADGKNYGTACCWDFGNASKDNCYGPTGIMVALYFGTGFWGKGAGNGPWFQADLEGGVWSGGSGGSGVRNQQLPSSNMDYAFGILKNSVENNKSQYAIRVANGQSGNLTTAYDGPAPKLLNMQGGIILGIGGDNSNHSSGTLFEGIITNGRPSDKIDTLVLKNVQAAGYGSNVVPTVFNRGTRVPETSLLQVNYNPATTKAVISYTLSTPRHVHMNVFNQQGKLVATVGNGIMPAGRNNVVWNANAAPSGVYIARMNVDGQAGQSGRIIVGR